MDIESRLVLFLYRLNRDYLPVGDINKLIASIGYSSKEDIKYTSETLLKLAQYQFSQLVGDQLC